MTPSLSLSARFQDESWEFYLFRRFCLEIPLCLLTRSRLFILLYSSEYDALKSLRVFAPCDV